MLTSDQMASYIGRIEVWMAREAQDRGVRPTSTLLVTGPQWNAEDKFWSVCGTQKIGDRECAVMFEVTELQAPV